jgi:membrane-associated phospholipid phosphatase
MFKTLIILLIASSALAGNPVSIFVSDATHIYTSPLRTDKEKAIKTGAFLTTFAIVFKYDQEISDAFGRNMDHTLYRPIRDYGEFTEQLGMMGTMNKFWYGGFLYGAATGQDRLRNYCGQIIEAHLISGGLRDLSTRFIGRNRPYGGQGPYSYSPGDGTSFLSGHSLGIWEIAAITSGHAKQKSISVLCYGTATAISLQRITSLQHWPSDVLLGSVTGYLIGKSLVKIHEKKEFALIPTFTKYGVGVSLAGSF